VPARLIYRARLTASGQGLLLAAAAPSCIGPSPVHIKLHAYMRTLHIYMKHAGASNNEDAVIISPINQANHVRNTMRIRLLSSCT
jgi:hypothetical protein